MSDLSRELPFSQRPRQNESAVTGDWRPQITEGLRTVAATVASLTQEAWGGPSQRDGWRVRDVAGHLVWRVGSTRLDLVRAMASGMLSHGMSPRLADAALSRAASDGDSGVASRRIEELADARLGPGERQGLADLSHVVVDGYDIGRSAGTPVTFSPVATGAVVLAQMLVAPTEIKAVVRNRALVSIDGGWTIGHGAPMYGTSEEIVLFLFGRSSVAPADEQPQPPLSKATDSDRAPDTDGATGAGSGRE